MKLIPTLERILAAAVTEYRVSDLTDFPGQQGGAITATKNPLHVLVPLLGWRSPRGIVLRSEWRLLEVQETDCVRLGELTTLLGRDVDDHECDECDGSGTILTWPYPNSVTGLMHDLCEALGWDWSDEGGLIVIYNDGVDIATSHWYGRGNAQERVDASLAAFLAAAGGEGRA
jgi:hypothetical protein